MFAILIDADNLSKPSWVDGAFRILENSIGPAAVRRAYGSAENLKGLGETFRAWAVRPFVNLSLSKNTTDVSLAVDAMDLSHQAPCPAVLAIGSGDADFLPLVVRLKERGITVVCVTERGKLAAEAMPAYDKIFYVGDDEDEGPQPAKASVDSTKRQSAQPLRDSEPDFKMPSAAKKVAKKAAKKVTNPKVTNPPEKKSVSTQAMALDTSELLKLIPLLKDGEWHSLSQVGKTLRDTKRLSKAGSSAKVFGRHPEHFELEPKVKPNKVRYVRR